LPEFIRVRVAEHDRDADRAALLLVDEGKRPSVVLRLLDRAGIGFSS
jgi:hypothetical protein